MEGAVDDAVEGGGQDPWKGLEKAKHADGIRDGLPASCVRGESRQEKEAQVVAVYV
jgi:hypothetical protein